MKWKDDDSLVLNISPYRKLVIEQTEVNKWRWAYVSDDQTKSLPIEESADYVTSGEAKGYAMSWYMNKHGRKR